MGSKSDSHIGEKITTTLEEFGIDYELRIISAHRAMDVLAEYIKEEKSDVYICVAGMAAHLAGAVAGMTHKPVIGVPAKSTNLDGMDSLLSTVQMPSGVPVATVAIDGGKNAAILAAQILAVSDSELSQKLVDYKETMKKNSVQ